MSANKVISQLAICLVALLPLTNAFAVSTSDNGTCAQNVQQDKYFAQSKGLPRFWASGWVNLDGGLEMELFTQKKDGQRNNDFTGHEQFKNIVEYFKGKFHFIQAKWVYGSNLKKFNEITKDSFDIKGAALATWTGQQSRELGYSHVEFIVLEGGPGHYTEVQVKFLCSTENLCPKLSPPP